MTSRLATKGLNGTALGFYTPLEASRIAQVPRWTVNAWRREGIIIPSVEWVDEQNKAHDGHTFETVVFLRLLKMLRAKNITLFEAVKAIKRLRDRFGPPSKEWAEVRIFVNEKDVYVYREDEWKTTVASKSHQKVAEFFFGEEFTRLKLRADALLIPNQFMDFVEIDPAVQSGLPIVLDTSVQTSLIHKLVQQGHGYSDIHEMYPFIPHRRIIGTEGYETFLDQASKN